MKWIHGREALETFLENANSFIEFSNDKHIFLYMMSHLVDGRVVVGLITKPSDSIQFILPTSCNTPHCSKNVPYSLAQSIRSICSDDGALLKRVKDLSEQLYKRRYKKQAVDQSI